MVAIGLVLLVGMKIRQAFSPPLLVGLAACLLWVFTIRPYLLPIVVVAAGVFLGGRSPAATPVRGGGTFCAAAAYAFVLGKLGFFGRGFFDRESGDDRYDAPRARLRWLRIRCRRRHDDGQRGHLVPSGGHLAFFVCAVSVVGDKRATADDGAGVSAVVLPALTRDPADGRGRDEAIFRHCPPFRFLSWSWFRRTVLSPAMKAPHIDIEPRS